MPTTRQPRYAKLPKYVYAKGGWYVYRRYLGVESGKAQFAPDRKLCMIDEPVAEVWRAFRALAAGARNDTLAWLFGEYLTSPQYNKLAEHTRKMYIRNARTIEQTQLKDGSLFGEAEIVALTPGGFRRYMDKRSEGAYVQANRELSFMKTAFAWAFERDLIKSNPVLTVKRNKETARDKYITDAEYAFVCERASAPVRAAMELAYLCRARIDEVMSFDRDMIGEDGLLLERNKGSKTQVIGWTPRLREAIRLGRVGRNNMPKVSRFIISKGDGSQMNYEGFKSAWARLKAKCKREGMAVTFTYHDIKAKGVSDFEGNKHAASGHKSPRMTAVYDRKTEIIKATR